jgi:hypothetical protein
MVFTALTACCIFNIARRSDLPTPPIGAMVTAALFILAQVGLIGVGLSMSKLLTFEFIGLITIGLAAYYVSIRNAGPTDGQGNPDRVG